jgi:predicted PurR-regulated permease PerM
VTPTGTTTWSKETRDRAFYVMLVASLLGVIWLFWPFITSLLFAGVTVVVVWPVFQRVLVAVGGRSGVATAITILLLTILLVGPAVSIIWIGLNQAINTWEQVSAAVRAGRVDVWLTEISARINTLPPAVTRLLPEGEGLVGLAKGPAKDAILGLLQLGGDLLPRALKMTLGAGLQTLVYLFSVVVLFVEGPRLIDAARSLLPIDSAYVDRLTDVFARFARTVILGSLVTAVLQGVVASIGFAIAGVDRIAFLGTLTSVCAFVPLVGTSVVWIPVSLALGFGQGEWGWALFVGVWSVALTGTVDNVVKPLLVRGNADIHPLLIFLAVFGGLYWMELPGLFVGPVLVAMFLALYHIFMADFGSAPPSDDAAAPPGSAPGS